MFFSKNKSILGVDIGTSYIKIAQVTHRKEAVLNTYGIVNVGGQIDSRSSSASVQQTATILKTLLTQARVTTKRCIVSMPNSAVFTSVIDMPSMSDQELDSAIRFEAKKYIPLPLSEVVLSWSIVSKNAAGNTIKILFIAVPKQVRESYVEVFQMAGLELEIIEIEALALIRSLIIDNAENNVIIDIGAKTTGLNIIKNGLLQLTRNLSVGGDTITDRIAQTLHISQVRAEQFKRDFGLSRSSFIPDAIKPVLSVIKSEVRQLLAIYQSHNMKVGNILLVGGGSNLPGIVEFFKDLGPQIALGSPLAPVAYAQSGEPLLKRFSLQLPIAIGLALRSSED